MDNPKTQAFFCIYRETKIAVTVEHVGAMGNI